MQSHSLKKLEFSNVLTMLLSFCQTYMGKDICTHLLPYHTQEEVEEKLQETTEAIILLERKSTPPLTEVPDITIWIKSLLNQQILSCKALLDLAFILKLARELKEYISSDIDTSFSAIVAPYFQNLYSHPIVENKIFHDIIDENTIEDSASSELKNIRKNQRKIITSIKDNLNHYIHSSSYAKFLQDHIITVRNDRFVIPVKQEYRNEIKGLIHDMSSTGSTVFIEPLSIFELNNELNRLKLEETTEIEKILQNLSSLFLPIIHELENNIDLFGKIDFAFAKAKFARSIQASLPVIHKEKYIDLKKARHPFIPKEKVVPIDLHIGKDFSSLIITGPNTGGKTVTLKTVGLLCLMGMSGLYIPAAENSSIFVFDTIFADIGDEQSIEESLSTFSSHMKNIIQILKLSTQNSLVLLDELGSGTDPEEGSCLAISILENLHQKGCLTIATTHYPELKNYALVQEGFENASSEFDLETLSPTYKLMIGIPGKSMAFAISQRLGLPTKILDSAKSRLNTSHISIEEILKNIYDTKAQIDKEKDVILKKSEEIENLRVSLEKDNKHLKEQEKALLENAKEEAKNILLEAKQEADDIIKELSHTTSSSTANQLRLQLKKDIKKYYSNENNSMGKLVPDDLKVGMKVFVKTLKQNGIILSSSNGGQEVQVQVGNIKINTTSNNLEKPSNSEQPTKIIPQKKSNFEVKSISSEINVIGLTVEEATMVIDKYLDEAFVARLSQVRIVHGKGTGALRSGIHSFLKKHPHVKSFRLGTFGEGEMGVTVVILNE